MPISYLVDGYSRMSRKTKSAMSAQIQIGMVIHMNLTTQEYEKLYQKASKNTKSYITIPKAFIIGGLICMLGQAFIDLYQHWGMTQIIASTLSSMTLVFLAALLTGLNVFHKIAKHAGAGTLVPITGFSNAVTCAAMEFKSEGWILGLGAKIFTIAGPVIVYVLLASALYGVILCILKLF